MKVDGVVTKVAAVLIATGIIAIYAQLNTLRGDLHAMETTFVKDIENVRGEIRQYHAIVGFMQREIDRIDNERHNN